MLHLSGAQLPFELSIHTSVHLSILFISFYFLLDFFCSHVCIQEQPGCDREMRKLCLQAISLQNVLGSPPDYKAARVDLGACPAVRCQVLDYLGGWKIDIWISEDSVTPIFRPSFLGSFLKARPIDIQRRCLVSGERGILFLELVCVPTGNRPDTYSGTIFFE